MTVCVPTNETFKFTILYEKREIYLELPQHSTVWDLKLDIFDKLEIVPSKQLIDCWTTAPEDDNDILGKCCATNSSYLVVYNIDALKMAQDREKAEAAKAQEAARFKALESCAAVDFIEYFSQHFNDQGIIFHACHLGDAISEACFTDIEKRKILLLYLHNKSDPFSKIFAENITQPKVKEMVNNSFFLLGWSLENEEYHPALIDALNGRAELSALVNFVESKKCAALLIVPIKNSFTLFSCLKDEVSKKDFVETLRKAEQFLTSENKIEKNLEKVEQSENDFNSVKYQQIMLDLLGDRDYDSFDFKEHNQLKGKIGYGLFGMPRSETGYEEKQKKDIDVLFEKIVEQNNKVAKWKDRVVLSVIFICTEPLPSEKQKRAKKYKDYNPNTDMTPVPLFILRRCKNSKNPCRIIIDNIGRVYTSWQQYLTENKLPECEMILPLNGRYQADENGNVVLERHLSPACGIDSKILQGTDIASTAVGLVSGGVFLFAAIPAITVAPVALVAAGVTGLGVGLYSLGRSAFTLYDRTKHEETLSFANSEARGAYLNIVAGSLGFVGAGANVALSQLATRGFNIGQGATAAVNVINVANIGASGISVVNSGYDVLDQWLNENRKPSLLTIVQLSSSILFFGHAVYNFKSATTIVEESQAQTLRDYHDSLRSNRHRKTFNKMTKETIRQNKGDVVKGQAEVIKTISNIQNKDEVFATLTRLNKKMNKSDVKFSAENGEVKLNGVPVDMNKFASMDNNAVATFLTTIPGKPEPTQSEIKSINSKVAPKLGDVMTKGELAFFVLDIAKIFCNTEKSIKDKVINTVIMVIRKLIGDPSGYFTQLNEMFPGVERFFKILQMVNGYFESLIQVLEEKYQQWLKSRDTKFEEPCFPELALEKSKRIVELFDYATKAYFVGNTLSEAGMKSLLNYFYAWFTKMSVEFEENNTRKQERVIHSGSPKSRAKCPICQGDYYH